MFRTLSAELARQNVRLKDISEAVGMSVPALSMRLNGKTKFTLEECVKIKKFLGVDMPIDELFAKEE